MGASALVPYLGAAFALHARRREAQAAKNGTSMATPTAPILRFQKFLALWLLSFLRGACEHHDSVLPLNGRAPEPI